jgi:AcrR family transcriptional regulator
MSATARVLARALEAPPETDPTAERILDGALRVAAAAGLRRLTIDDVAARAGVGRMTVYRRFGSREELVEGLTARECPRPRCSDSRPHRRAVRHRARGDR